MSGKRWSFGVDLIRANQRSEGGGSQAGNEMPRASGVCGSRRKLVLRGPQNNGLLSRGTTQVQADAAINNAIVPKHGEPTSISSYGTPLVGCPH